MKKGGTKRGAFPWHWVWIPLAVAVVPVLGSMATTGGLDWYDTLMLPSWTPSGGFIGAVWSVLYTLLAVAGVLAWEHSKTPGQRRLLATALAVNLVLNLAWSIIFFGLQQPGWALVDIVPLAVSIVVLITITWPLSRTAGLMLVPYFLWVCFATFLNASIAALN